MLLGRPSNIFQDRLSNNYEDKNEVFRIRPIWKVWTFLNQNKKRNLGEK